MNCQVRYLCMFPYRCKLAILQALKIYASVKLAGLLRNINEISGRFDARCSTCDETREPLDGVSLSPRGFRFPNWELREAFHLFLRGAHGRLQIARRNASALYLNSGLFGAI